MRLYHEGATASLMVAGVDLSFAIAMLVPHGQGRITQVIAELELTEVWVLAFLIAAVVTVAGVLRPTNLCRKLSFKLNSLVCFSTYAVLLFNVPGLTTSAFGNVMLLTGVCSLLLFWMDEREDMRRQARSGGPRHARQA